MFWDALTQSVSRRLALAVVAILAGFGPGGLKAQNLPRPVPPPTIRPLPPGEIQVVEAPAFEAMTIAIQNGFLFGTDNRTRDRRIRCLLTRERGRVIMTVRYDGAVGGFDFGAANLPQICAFRLFGNRTLAPGWVMVGQAEVGFLFTPIPITGAKPCSVEHGRLFIGEQRTGGGPTFPLALGNPYPERPLLLIQTAVDLNNNRCSLFRWVLNSVRLNGPAGQDWREAFR